MFEFYRYYVIFFFFRETPSQLLQHDLSTSSHDLMVFN